MSFDSSKPDIYEQVTQALIAALEEGAGEYRMPWHSLAHPVNATSQKAYRGINTLLLWAAAQKRKYESNEWATYRQWQDLGGQVRKGERSTLIVFWKFFDSNKESDETADEDSDTSTNKRSRCMARAYHVFNAAQVDNAPVKPMKTCRNPNASLTPKNSLPPFPAMSSTRANRPTTHRQTTASTCHPSPSSNPVRRFTVFSAMNEPTGVAHPHA